MKTKSFLLLTLTAMLNLSSLQAQVYPTAPATPPQTNPATGITTYGGVNYDSNGNRTGPYYLDTYTINSAATIGPAGGSASATGVPMGATPTTATGVPMGATPTTGTGATIGVQTLSQWCASNPGADACKNNQPPVNPLR